MVCKVASIFAQMCIAHFASINSLFSFLSVHVYSASSFCSHMGRFFGAHVQLHGSQYTFFFCQKNQRLGVEPILFWSPRVNLFFEFLLWDSLLNIMKAFTIAQFKIKWKMYIMPSCYHGQQNTSFGAGHACPHCSYIYCIHWQHEVGSDWVRCGHVVWWQVPADEDH